MAVNGWTALVYNHDVQGLETTTTPMFDEPYHDLKRSLQSSKNWLALTLAMYPQNRCITEDRIDKLNEPDHVGYRSLEDFDEIRMYVSQSRYFKPVKNHDRDGNT